MSNWIGVYGESRLKISALDVGAEQKVEANFAQSGKRTSKLFSGRPAAAFPQFHRAVVEDILADHVEIVDQVAKKPPQAPIPAVLAAPPSAPNEIRISDATIVVLRDALAARRSEGLTSALTKAFELSESQGTEEFRALIADTVENLIATLGAACARGEWNFDIGSRERVLREDKSYALVDKFSSAVGEEFRVRFPISYDQLPIFLASVYQDLLSSLRSGCVIRGKWGRLQFDPNSNVLQIVPRLKMVD